MGEVSRRGEQIFILNARQENTADAQVRALDAQLAFQQAVEDFALVTADRARLGLAPLPQWRRPKPCPY